MALRVVADSTPRRRHTTLTPHHTGSPLEREHELAGWPATRSSRAGVYAKPLELDVWTRLRAPECHATPRHATRRQRSALLKQFTPTVGTALGLVFHELR